MSVIQTLRDKYATVVVIVVCISLVAFLLMDAFVGPKSFFKKDNEVVVVNGVGYQYNDYMQEVKVFENNYRNQNPQAKITDEVRNQIKTQVYNKFVQDQILQGEYDALGIAFSPEELTMLTVTNDAAPQIKQVPDFQNPQTGTFDPNRVVSFIQSLRQAPENNQQAQMMRYQWMQMEQSIKDNALITKFSSLITNGIYVPTWLSKEKAKENMDYSNISFVSASYTSIPDSSVKISTSDLQSYLDSHQKLYEIEASRSIEYISFDAIPSAKDSAKVLGNIKSLAEEFDTLDNSEVSGFIARNSETQFTDRYIPESLIQSSVKSDLLNLPDGKVYGPYMENNMVVYAKKLGQRKIADSVTIQQLMLSNQMMPDSVAKFRIDSIYNAVQHGADFADMVSRFSNTETTNGGEMTFSPANPNVPDEFLDFVMAHKDGDVGVVTTQYGYHLIKVIGKHNMEPGYKIAYLSASMDPSQETDNSIFSEANKFRGLNQTRDQFEKAAKEQGYNIKIAKDIPSSAFEVNGLPSSRDIIHWAYDADVNDVSKVFVLPKQYVIAVLTGKQEKGVASLESVRPQLESVVRREKKGALLSEKLKGNSLSEIASALKDTVSTADHINFAADFVPNFGFEPKVVGASFNTGWKGKISTPVYGNNGVYVLQIDSIQSIPVDSVSLAQMKTETHNLLQQQVNMQLRNVLVKQADIEDRRIKFPGL